MIKSKGFYINLFEDSSVGIFGGKFEINGDFEFESTEELNAFKDILRETFEFVAELSSIETKEEFEEFMIKE